MKIKIKNNIAPISDSEINETKDFQFILKRRNRYLSKLQSLNNYRIKVLLSILILASLGLVIYFANNLSINDKDQQKNNFKAPLSKLPMDSALLISPIENPPFSKDKVPEEIDKSLSEKSEKVTKPDVRKKAINNEPENQGKPNDKAEAKPNEVVYAYKEAYPIVGMDSLYKYLDKTINYPKDVSISDSIQGTSIVQFTIDQKGKASEIKVENSLGEAFDRECVRLIKNMPPWEPAKINGKPTSSKMSVPLKFNID